MLSIRAHLDVVCGAAGVAAADVVDGGDAEAVLLVLREAGGHRIEEARVRNRVLKGDSVFENVSVCQKIQQSVKF